MYRVGPSTNGKDLKKIKSRILENSNKKLEKTNEEHRNDTCKKNSSMTEEMYLEREKISVEIRSLFFIFFCAEDLSFEINVDIAGYGRKTRHLLPRDPFPIPTISSKVEF